MKKPEIIFEPPVMSWDQPIEEEILTFVRSMKRSWQVQESTSIWPSVRKAARAYVSAYEMVEKHIVREVELRAEVFKNREENIK